MYEVVIPKLGLDTLECDVRSWLVAIGDHVQRGTPLLEVESEKAVITIEAEVGGSIRELRVQPGQTVPVGSVVALIGD